jgi:hypothetical protein
MQVINGANFYFFQPSHSGNYALIAQDSLCIDTSDCHTFIALSTIDLPNSIVYINSLENESILVSHFPTNTTLKIFNSLGELVWTKKECEGDFEIDCKNWAAGIYFTSWMETGRLQYKRLVIAH